MHTIESKTDSGKLIIDEWLTEARASGPSGDWMGNHRSPRYAWAAPLDVHIQSEGRRARTLIAKARDVSGTGLAFVCREALPTYARLTVCRAGERTGLAAKVINRTQTIGGYIIGVEFVVEGHVVAATSAVA